MHVGHCNAPGLDASGWRVLKPMKDKQIREVVIAYRQGGAPQSQLAKACMPIFAKAAHWAASRVYRVDADDIAQELWLKIDTIVERYDDTQSFSTYVSGYAKKLGMGLAAKNREVLFSEIIPAVDNEGDTESSDIVAAIVGPSQDQLSTLIATHGAAGLVASHQSNLDFAAMIDRKAALSKAAALLQAIGPSDR